MRRGLLRRLFLFAVGSALLSFVAASCSTKLDTGITLSGTVSSYGFAVISPATLTVSQGSNVFSVGVTVPNSGVAFVAQNGTYSITGIPSGSYTVAITLTNSAIFRFFTDYPRYTINGGSFVLPDNVAGGSGTVTITFNNVTISDSETLDIDLGNYNAG